MKFSLKLFTQVIGVLSLLFLTHLSVSANELSGPILTLEKYLEAVKEENIDEVIKNVKDERYVNEEPNLQKNEYTYKINKQKLDTFKILDSEKVNDRNHLINTELSFDNGEIVQVPFTLLENDGVWKVYISDGSLQDKDAYKVIEEGEPIISIRPFEVGVTWSFSGRSSGSTFYSTNSFDIMGTAATLYGDQTHSYVNEGRPVQVTYQVVEKKWFGDDTVWGGTTITGSGSFTNRISGIGNMYDVHMKFKTAAGFTSSMGYKGSGRLEY